MSWSLYLKGFDMFTILRCCLLLGFFLISSVVEQTQEERILSITREILQTLYGVKEPVPLSSEAKQQIRDIAKRLVADTVSENAFQQVLADAEKQEREKSVLLSKIMRNVGIGVIICLALFIVIIVGRKIGEARGKIDLKVTVNDLKVTVNDRLRSAPYVLIIPARSESDAGRVGRILVEERLVARADIFEHHFLSQDEEAVLVLNTVRGRLKELKKRMVDLSVSGPYLSLPVLHGHGEYLNWIADVADGRG